MKKIIRVLPRGLQKKTVLLVLIMLIATTAVFLAVSSYENRMLTKIVADTRTEQQQAISQTSQQTMHQILSGTMVRTNALQAKVADNDFSEVVNNIYTLHSMAQGILEDRHALTPAVVNPPDPSLDGQPSVMVLCEEGVDYRNSEDLGILGNLARPMLALLENSDKTDACFIGLEDGTFLCVDDQSKNKLDAAGNPIPFQVRERPWYVGAVQTNAVYFTGLEADAFSGSLMVTCSIPIHVGGRLVGVAGLDIVMGSMRDFVQSLDSSSTVFLINENGHVILSSQKEGVFSAAAADGSRDLRETGNPELAAFVDKALNQATGLELLRIGETDYYCVGTPMPTVGWAVISVVGKEDTEQPERAMLTAYDAINQEASTRFYAESTAAKRNGGLMIGLLFVVSLCAALFASRRLVKPLQEMTDTIIDSGKTGRLFEMKDSYRTNDEIEVLAEAFDDLSKKTKRYIEDITQITKEKERVNTELNMANQIQVSMLPHIFPAFPTRKEFDIYASMTPAKEVGGDFYDFFLLDSDHLCMVIADVSGKGIPAALFMMVSKAILKNNAMGGKSVGEILSLTNDTICSNNKMEMFVTVWIGILEISTGKITAANAGHEYPALEQNGRFSLLKDKHGFVIGGMEGMKYRPYEIQLQPGDRVFLYTDGVPEATNADRQMFGTDRMLEALNREADASPNRILDSVRKAVDDFVKDSEQFDDLTMLCIEYKGPGQK